MFDRYFFGILIIFIGIGLLLSSTGIIYFENVGEYWFPAGLTLMGLFVIARSKRALLPGIVMILLGLSIIGERTGIIQFGFWQLFWPLVLISLGLWIIFRKNRIFTKEKVVNTNFPNFVTIFSGTKHLVESENFRGADVEVVFGGTVIDLRRAIIAPEGATIDITCSFGGTVIYVPKNWKIRTSGSPIFGALENKTRQEEINEFSPVLNIKFFVMFGGIEIKNKLI